MQEYFTKAALNGGDSGGADLFTYRPPIEGDRDGLSYNHNKDFTRLNRQAQAVYTYMQNGLWRTLSEISQATGAPEASVSARLRDLRKSRFGGYPVERRRADKGLWEYRLDVRG